MTSKSSKSALVFAVLLAAAAGCDDRSNTGNQDQTNPSGTGATDTGTTNDRPATTPSGTLNRSTTPGSDPSTTNPSGTSPSRTSPSGTTPSGNDPSGTPSTQPGSPSTNPPASPPQGNARDQQIVEEVRAMLRHDSTMSAVAETIQIDSRDGVVTLSGRVMSQAEKDTIEARVQQVTGVVRIVNNLDVEP